MHVGVQQIRIRWWNDMDDPQQTNIIYHDIKWIRLHLAILNFFNRYVSTNKSTMILHMCIYIYTYKYVSIYIYIHIVYIYTQVRIHTYILRIHIYIYTYVFHIHHSPWFPIYHQLSAFLATFTTTALAGAGVPLLLPSRPCVPALLPSWAWAGPLCQSFLAISKWKSMGIY